MKFSRVKIFMSLYPASWSNTKKYIGLIQNVMYSMDHYNFSVKLYNVMDQSIWELKQIESKFHELVIFYLINYLFSMQWKCGKYSIDLITLIWWKCYVTKCYNAGCSSRQRFGSYWPISILRVISRWSYI